MLDADVLAVERVPRVRDVAGSMDTGSARLQELIREDPVLDLEAGGLGELGAGSDAHADDDEVGVEQAAVGGANGLDLARALE